MSDTVQRGYDEQVVDVWGEPVAVRRAGRGAPVLFLHGAHFPTRWLPFHDTLASHVELTAPIGPGYAEGGPPKWLEGFDDLVLWYRALLDGLALEAVHVVGYDLGGWVGADLAIFCPDRVRSLTVVAPMGLRVAGHPVLEFLGAAPEALASRLFNGDPGALGDVLADLSTPEGFAMDYGERAVTVRLIWERRYDLKLERRLPRISCPSLVIAAERDQVVPDEHPRRWAELLPDSRVVTIPGTGHALVVQEPLAAADAVAAFVAEQQA